MASEVQTVLDMLASPEFLVGLAAGAVAFVALLVIPEGRKSWALAVAIATISGITLTEGRALGLTLGVVLLWAGGFWLDRQRSDSDPGIPDVVPWGVLAIGAILVTLGSESAAWTSFIMPVVVLGFGHLLSRWADSTRQGLAGPLFVVTAAGIWLTVPETEMARVLLGASILPGVATVRPFMAKIMRGGAFALAGVVAFVVAIGGEAREASIVGGWACMGMLALLPLLHVDRRGLRNWVVVAMHIVLVLIASRVIGLWESAAVAMVAVAVVGGVSFGTIRVMAPAPD